MTDKKAPIIPDKYLVVKRPTEIIFHYCRNDETQGLDHCIHMPSLAPAIETHIFTYISSLPRAKAEYEKMKEAGLILHEFDDYETALVLQQEMMKEAKESDSD